MYYYVLQMLHDTSLITLKRVEQTTTEMHVWDII